MTAREEDLQDPAAQLRDGFTAEDHVSLAGLTESELEAQVDARRALYDYVSAIWERLKADGLDPAGRSEYAAIVGMLDLLDGLVTNANAAESSRR